MVRTKIAFQRICLNISPRFPVGLSCNFVHASRLRLMNCSLRLVSCPIVHHPAHGHIRCACIIRSLVLCIHLGAVAWSASASLQSIDSN